MREVLRPLCFLGTLVIGGSLIGCSTAPKVTVTPAKFGDLVGTRIKPIGQGWRLSNGTVEALVLPSLGGRVMRFGRVGGENLFWVNPELTTLATQLPAQRPSDWANFGGEKTWVWPTGGQDAWPKLWGASWPPPLAFDRLPFSSTKIPGGVRLTSEIDPGQQVQLIREITLQPDGKLRVRSIVRDATAENLFPQYRTVPAPALGSLALTPWVVGQITWPAEVRIPNGASSKTIMGDTPSATPWPGLTSSGPDLILPAIPGPSAKIGATSNTLTARWPSGTELTATLTSSTPGSLEVGKSAQVYRSERQPSPQPGDYIELELIGQLAPLPKSGSVEMTVEWELRSPLP